MATPGSESAVCGCLVIARILNKRTFTPGCHVLHLHLQCYFSAKCKLLWDLFWLFRYFTRRQRCLSCPPVWKSTSDERIFPVYDQRWNRYKFAVCIVSSLIYSNNIAWHLIFSLSNSWKQQEHSAFVHTFKFTEEVAGHMYNVHQIII